METTHSPRKRVNLTIPESLLEEARELGVNLSSSATAGIAAALKKAKEEEWLEENKRGIEAHNRRIKERGTLLPPIWQQRDGAV